LFDEVQIEVLLSNATSRRFHPKTGILQGVHPLALFLLGIYKSTSGIPTPSSYKGWYTTIAVSTTLELLTLRG
jgi:cyanate permease